MSVLEQIRRRGFTLKPVDAGLYIEPIDDLTDVQRQWLIQHKPEIRRHLLDERWKWFVSLATEHGIHPAVAAAEFPSLDDRLDVIEPAEHDDDMLHACMATLCADARVRSRQYDYQCGLWMPVNPDSTLT